jgi:hypothetical protein
MCGYTKIFGYSNIPKDLQNIISGYTKYTDIQHPK